MEIHLTPEKEAKLNQLAARSGKNTAEFLQEAVDQLLEYESWFVQEVEKGLTQAKRGELIDHDELVARIEQRLKPCSDTFRG
jgi:predicted transcriptional regulator